MSEHTLKRPEIDLRQAARTGVIGGIAAVFTAATGMLATFAERSVIDSILTMGYMILLLVPLIISYLAARPPAPVEGMPEPEIGSRNVIAGVIAGLAAGLVVVIFDLGASALNQEGLRRIFINISPTMYELLRFGQPVGLGLALLVALFTVLGGLGGLMHVIPSRWLRPVVTAVVWVLSLGVMEGVVTQILRQTSDTLSLPAFRSLAQFLFKSTGGLTLAGAIAVAVVTLVGSIIRGSQPKGFVQQRLEAAPESQRRIVTVVGYLLLAFLILFLPRLIGSFLSEVLDLVGIFAIMALGLNIVLGYAGMLDLGYVAFFAVGAYTTAVLTSPNAPRCALEAGACPQISFWLALPVVIIAAIIAGIIVGTPVIRMRGDYLAIVTLGFGEIARLIIQSDWFKPVLGAAQGIISIPKIVVGPYTLSTPPQFFYPILGFVIVSVYALWRLQDSRVGRAWVALREDERVAEVMGINIVTTKLSAFITGAVLASFSGALFASKLGSIFPNSFNIEKSIQVLIIVIVGGIGSIPGMVAAAFLIIGVPELLREFDEFRFLAYGVLLVVMMLNRPEGLIPNQRVARLLTEEETMQDAWLRAQAASEQESEQESEGVTTEPTSG